MTGGWVTLSPVIAATWPPRGVSMLGPFRIAENDGGGSRVRAARLADPAADGAQITDSDIDRAEAAMSALGQPTLFMVGSGQDALDTRLSDHGYSVQDPTLALSIPTATLAAAPPPVTCFQTWPPLAIQQDIWAQSGIGTDRLAIMLRAKGPKFSVFGRINDRPAGTAFVALHGKAAMLHALEVLPAARRSGLARHMMRAAALWAQDAGASYLAVLVTRENSPARALYASLGFEPVGHYHYRAKTA